MHTNDLLRAGFILLKNIGLKHPKPKNNSPPVKMDPAAIETSESRGKATSIEISGKPFAIYGDDDYLRNIGSEFEPDTVTILELLSDHLIYRLIG